MYRDRVSDNHDLFCNRLLYSGEADHGGQDAEYEGRCDWTACGGFSQLPSGTRADSSNRHVDEDLEHTINLLLLP
jgi:hypothetical protein